MSGKTPTQTNWLSTVGVATHFAATLDALLVNLLRVVSGLNPRKAKALYFAPDAQPTRYKIIRALAEDFPAEQAAHIDAIIEACKRVYSKRNELAHSFVVRDETKKSADPADPVRALRIHLRHPKQPAKPLTEEYLESMIQPVRDDTLVAEGEYQELCRKLGVPSALRF